MLKKLIVVVLQLKFVAMFHYMSMNAKSLFVEEHGEDCQLRGSIQLLWSKVDNSVTVPLLKGAKLGKDREDYIEYLEQFADLFEAEREEDIKKVEEGQKKQ
eukprot:UN01524